MRGTETADEELEAIAAIYAQELVYIKRDADVRAAGARLYARLLFRFASAVTSGCASHRGVFVAIGMPIDYPAASLNVAAALGSEAAAAVCGEEGDGERLAACLEDVTGSCGCQERLIRLAPILREDVRAKGGIWVPGYLPPASRGSDRVSISRQIDGVDDSPLGLCPR